MARTAKVVRKTKETEIELELDIESGEDSDIFTPVPFFTHMLDNFSRHGLFCMNLDVKGDVEVDLHHTVEDVGLALGEAFKEALGDKHGIRRCATASVPMMDALTSVVVDISGRPYFRFDTTRNSYSVAHKSVASVVGQNLEKAFDIDLTCEFLKALSNSAGLDLHVKLEYGRDVHHSIESIFKALGRALSGAVEIDKRIKGVPSTKGTL